MIQDANLNCHAEDVDTGLPAWFRAFLNNVCEISNGNSHDDEPEVIVATLEELKTCALNAIEQRAPDQLTVVLDSDRVAGWVRNVQVYTPGEVMEWDVEFCPGEDKPDGDGWAQVLFSIKDLGEMK